MNKQLQRSDMFPAISLFTLHKIVLDSREGKEDLFKMDILETHKLSWLNQNTAYANTNIILHCL